MHTPFIIGGAVFLTLYVSVSATIADVILWKFSLLEGLRGEFARTLNADYKVGTA